MLIPVYTLLAPGKDKKLMLIATRSSQHSEKRRSKSTGSQRKGRQTCSRRPLLFEPISIRLRRSSIDLNIYV